MAYAAWTASTAFVVGDVVRATTQTGDGLVFRCSTAGTSGATEPDWPKITLRTTPGFGFEIPIEGFVEDGTVYWDAVSAVSAELQTLLPSAVIELFELELIEGVHYAAGSPPATTVYRFHAGTNELSGNVTWNGQAYTRFPVQAEGFEYSAGGQLPTPSLRVANLNGLLTLALLEVNDYTPGNDLINARVTRIRTLKKYLDAVNFISGTNPTADPYAEFPREVYFISRKVTETRNLIEWQLASIFDMQGVRAPKRQAIQRCQWIYKSAECGYSPVNSFTGTWSRSGTVLTVTFASHGLITNDAVHLSNIPVPGIYMVTAYSANTFNVTVSNTGATTGSVTATQWFDLADQPTYIAANDVCAKRLTSCEKRFGTTLPLPFGGFPGVGQFS